MGVLGAELGVEGGVVLVCKGAELRGGLDSYSAGIRIEVNMFEKGTNSMERVEKLLTPRAKVVDSPC